MTTLNSSSLYGRSWSLQLYSASGAPFFNNPGSDDGAIVGGTFQPETLRVTFDVYTAAIQNQYWYADISIYNINPTSVPTIINAGNNVTPGMICQLKAGYVNNLDTIWLGPIFQPTFVRENVTDYRLTLHCVLSLLQATSGYTMQVAYANTNQAEVVTQMIKALGIQANVSSADIATLSATKFPYDKVIYGDASGYLDSIAKQNNMVWFLEQRGIGKGGVAISLGSPTTGNALPPPSYTYTPSTGLIGTPQQTQKGVNFSVLLDPRIKAKLPWQSLEIKEAIVSQFTVPPPPNAAVPYFPLQSDGIYIASEVRHRGDSRGNDWQTDVTGVSVAGNVLATLVGAA